MIHHVDHHAMSASTTDHVQLKATPAIPVTIICTISSLLMYIRKHHDRHFGILCIGPFGRPNIQFQTEMLIEIGLFAKRNNLSASI